MRKTLANDTPEPFRVRAFNMGKPLIDLNRSVGKLLAELDRLERRDREQEQNAPIAAERRTPRVSGPKPQTDVS